MESEVRTMPNNDRNFTMEMVGRRQQVRAAAGQGFLRAFYTADVARRKLKASTNSTRASKIEPSILVGNSSVHTESIGARPTST